MTDAIQKVLCRLNSQRRIVYGPKRRYLIPRMSRMWWHLSGLYFFHRFKLKRRPLSSVDRTDP